MRKHSLKNINIKRGPSTFSYGKFLGTDFVIDNSGANTNRAIYGVYSNSELAQPLTASDHLVSSLRAITNGKSIPLSFIRNIEPVLLEKLPYFSLTNIYDVTCLLKSAKRVTADIINVLLGSVNVKMQRTVPEPTQTKLAVDSLIEIVGLYKDEDKTVIGACLSSIYKYIEYCNIFQLFRIVRIYKKFIRHIEIKQLEKLTTQASLHHPADLFPDSPLNLTHCSFVVDLMELISLNWLFGTSCRFGSHICNREYATKVLYPLIKENTKVFTADQITKIVESVRIIGEPYPTDLLKLLSSIYIKHISQYSFKNMMNLIGNLTKMNVSSENLLISTLSFLPRKMQSIDSVEDVILLLDTYFENHYISEYFNVFITQQMLQLSHKIGKKHYQELTNKLNRAFHSIPENGKTEDIKHIEILINYKST